MSSPEVEKFEVTEDDLANEFNPYRKQARMSKSQALYGMWADDSDDDGRPSFKGKKKKEKDYKMPVSFISGGIKVGDKITTEGKDENDPVTDSDEEFTASSSTLSISEKVSKTSFRGSAYKKASGYEQESGVGKWERHTKGIGAKLLEKMGHVPGKGLGKNLQGISKPVEAVVRKGKGAIGFYGTERVEKSLKDFPMKADIEEEEREEREFKEQMQRWKKTDDTKTKKPKHLYKTFDEVIAGGAKKSTVVQSELSKVKVIDMTGKEQRVLSGYQAMSNKHSRPEEDIPVEKKAVAFEMPEIMHNLDLLVNMAEEEIIQNNKRLIYQKDHIVNLRYEQTKLNDLCKEEEKQVVNLKEVLSLVQLCERRSKAENEESPLTFQDIADVLNTLRDCYYEEYKLYDLSSLAIALVSPLMKKEFQGWEPLKKPRHGVELVTNWKALLQDSEGNYSTSDRFGQMSPYDRLMWETWMPHVRTAVLNKWSVRNCDLLINVIDAWRKLLPDFIVFNILDQLVMPKLMKEIDDWNPLTDVTPIHAWLHPWLPLMADRMEPLYAPIRHKLANALTSWHPSDKSAKCILEPWKNVFKYGHMSMFLIKYIVPKLALCLQELIINPQQQQLDAWNWVMDWLDMVPLQNMVEMIEKAFFPRWLQILCAWLSNNPNYHEVTTWYTGWKRLFPEQLLNEPTIRDQFNKALELMNRAVSGNFQPGARENVSYLLHTERRRELSAPSVPQEKMRDAEMAKGVASVSSSIPNSFKELIEKKAEENDLDFVPVINKSYESKQIYKFGKLQIYIDRGVIYSFENQRWGPVSLQNLVDRAR